VRGDDRFSGANDPEHARSALSLRLVLALIGVLAFAFIAMMLARMDVPTLLILVPLLFAVVGLVDVGIVIARLRSGRR
jgi:cation transporter-like permease